MPVGCCRFEYMKALLKKIAFSGRWLVPPPVARWLRCRYYYRVVSSFRESSWEWAGVVRPLVSPGAHVIDIGANVGYLSRWLAEWVGSGGRVVSVEPIPDTYRSLAYSMARLFGSRVITLPRCVSDRSGVVQMAVPRYADGGENFYESRIVRDGGHGTGERVWDVRACTLDELVAEFSLSPAFIKIDVEGHELSVIRGGASLLQHARPPLLIEVSGNPDDPETPAHELFRLLHGWGYVPLTLDGGRLRDRIPGDQAIDYLFVSTAARGSMI